MDARQAMRRILYETSREEFIQRGTEVCDRNSYLNCKLFAQLASGQVRLQDLPVVAEPRSGDIISWAPRHYAIYIGAGEAMHVPEWGGEFGIVSLDELVAEYDQPQFLSVP